MGGCFSLGGGDLSQQKAPCSAYVVSTDGELHQYDVPVKASRVLLSEASTSPNNPYFICNSDRLNFEDYIPSLDAEEELERGQIYFVLPETKLRYRLTASEMAALAVKAGAALEHIHRTARRKRKFSPEDGGRGDREANKYVKVNNVFVIHGDNTVECGSTIGMNYNSSANSSNVVRRTTSFARSNKLARSSSKRAKLAVRSFKIKLSTIYEGSVLSS